MKKLKLFAYPLCLVPFCLPYKGVTQ